MRTRGGASMYSGRWAKRRSLYQRTMPPISHFLRSLTRNKHQDSMHFLNVQSRKKAENSQQFQTSTLHALKIIPVLGSVLMCNNCLESSASPTNQITTSQPAFKFRSSNTAVGIQAVRVLIEEGIIALGIWQRWMARDGCWKLA